jgi:hypothetical protein
VKTTVHGVGHFDDIDTMTRTDLRAGAATDFWQAQINTNGSSDLHVLENTIAPGGSFGWHRHPGPSLVIVKSGTATFYRADDATCSPVQVATGSGFVDHGGDEHVGATRATSIS